MIRVENIAKQYGTVRALAGVDFQVQRGETFGIIGPNGAGKTTLLKILLGLVRPDRGTVRVDGVDLTSDPRGVRRLMGYVPQRAVFEEGATGIEALRFLARLRSVPEAGVVAYAAQARVEHLLDRPVGTLSGGQRQRLSLAASLLGDPPVLLLDEPTASLDPQATADFRALVERLAAEGRTMILCSHLLADVERLCHRVLVLLDGQVAAVESMTRAEAVTLHVTVTDAEAARAVIAEFGDCVVLGGSGALRAELPPGEQLRLLVKLHQAGVGVSSFETRRPTLEERFLATVANKEVSGEP
jgi:ABC-type multidrug transport system ATPase subunit